MYYLSNSDNFNISNEDSFIKKHKSHKSKRTPILETEESQKSNTNSLYIPNILNNSRENKEIFRLNMYLNNNKSEVKGNNTVRQVRSSFQNLLNLKDLYIYDKNEKCEKNEKIMDNFNCYTSIQKSREYTSKFNKFDSNRLYYDNELKEKIIKTISQSYHKNNININMNINQQNNSSDKLQNDVSSDHIEDNLRIFYIKNNNKFKERIAKGPPSLFRWISWIIVSKIPEFRKENLYILSYLNMKDDATELQIKKDLNRSYPCQFIENLSEDEISNKEFSLYRLLKSFAGVDSEVLYCQGMNFIANFILFMSNYKEIDAFYIMIALFSNTYSSIYGVRGFFTKGFPLLQFYLKVFHINLEQRNSKLSKHLLINLELKDEAWIGKWMMTMFTISFPFEVVMRIWDCIFIYGIEFIIKFSLAMMTEIEFDILNIHDTSDFIEYFKEMSPFENEDINDIAIYNMNAQEGKVKNLRLKYKFNIEKVIKSACSVKLNKEISMLKKQYEEKTNIRLSKENIKYDIRKEIDLNSIYEIKSSTGMTNEIKEESHFSKENLFNSIVSSDKSDKVDIININSKVLFGYGHRRSSVNYSKESSSNNINENIVEEGELDIKNENINKYSFFVKHKNIL